jgi:hypothetical protein
VIRIVTILSLLFLLSGMKVPDKKISFIKLRYEVYQEQRWAQQKEDLQYRVWEKKHWDEKTKWGQATRLFSSYYVSPSGNDGNSGTEGSPWKTPEKLTTAGLVAGDIVYFRGGTYTSVKAGSENLRFTFNNLNGASGNVITIRNYVGESPVFDCGGTTLTDQPVGLFIEQCQYIHVIGIRVTNMPTAPFLATMFQCADVDDSIIENCAVDDGIAYGFVISIDQQGNNNPSTNLTFLDCDASYLQDPPTYNGSNGFGCTGDDPSTDLFFINCRAWWNGDDGFDFFNTDGIFTLNNCWAFWNGYIPGSFDVAGNGVGFKLGPANTLSTTQIKRFLNNCLAVHNQYAGYDQNAGASDAYRVQMYNNTAFGNEDFSYFFGALTSIQQIFKNNSGEEAQINGSEILSGTNIVTNSWNDGRTFTSADFKSISETGLDGPRRANGDLPDLFGFGLADNSDLLNAGTNVGLPFYGLKPDINWLEVYPPESQKSFMRRPRKF